MGRGTARLIGPYYPILLDDQAFDRQRLDTGVERPGFSRRLDPCLISLRYPSKIAF